MNVKVWVNDDEFGEDFPIDVSVADVVTGLKRSGLPWVERVADSDGRVRLWYTTKPSPKPGVWFCVRVGDE